MVKTTPETEYEGFYHGPIGAYHRKENNGRVPRRIGRGGGGDGGGGGAPDLKGIMESLAGPNFHMIGLWGMNDDQMGNHLNTIIRRATRDDLFGVTVMVSISDDKPDLTRIQQDIARELGFTYQEQDNRTPRCFVFPDGNKKAAVITENARQLSDRIRTHPKILFILRDLHTKLDLAQLGIPFGQDHSGCKLILTSESNEILSDQMKVQRSYRL